MATMTASHFVSRSSHVNCEGTSGSETKATFAQIGLRKQTMTHHGLRSLNKVDMLQMRTNAKTTARQAKRKGSQTENNRPWGVIISGSGMNLIFVGAEVGPWSKTSGLGDVLGATTIAGPSGKLGFGRGGGGYGAGPTSSSLA